MQWLTGMSLDLKLGARMLRKSPGLTLVAAFALAVGIGGGAAYMEFITDVFRPKLQFAQGDRVVGLYNWDAANNERSSQSLYDFASWRENLRGVTDLGAYRSLERNLITADGRSEPVHAVAISASAFRVTGVRPQLGRALHDDDEQPGAAPVAVLGHELWQSRFGGDAAIVGRSIRLASSSYTIVGVMPPGFAFPVNHSMWLPLRMNATSVAPGDGFAISMFGRLAPGTSLAAAQTELATLGARAAADHPATHQHLRPVVKRYVDAYWGEQATGPSQILIMYSINIFFLGLLAVCGANVATLVFARTTTRESEITVRTALGASRGRIASQLFAEALVLAALAAIAGVTGAWLGLRWIKQTMLDAQNGQLPFWWTDGISTPTLAYAALLTILAALIVGVVPALKATGPRLQARLRDAADGGSGMNFGKLWTGVIVTQVALTVILLSTIVSVGWNLRVGQYGMRDLTFPTREYFSLRLEMDLESPSGVIPRDSFNATFDRTYRELARSIASQPGVSAVTYGSRLPGTTNRGYRIDIDGVTARNGADAQPWVRSASVDAGFLPAFGARMIAGRAFNSSDAEEGRPVVIVDQTFVDRILGGQDPVGRRIRRAAVNGESQTEWAEVIGVVSSLTTPDGKTDDDAMFYRPATPSAAYPLYVAVRATGDPNALESAIRATSASLDPRLRLYDMMTVDKLDKAGLATIGFLTAVLTLLCGLALLLSTAGMYSLMSFIAARRTREIGIRAALGAAPRLILTGTFARAFLQIGVGVLIGCIPGSILIAAGAPEVTRGFGLAGGIGAFLGLSGFMVLIGVLASIVPARRALRVQPIQALRGS